MKLDDILIESANIEYTSLHDEDGEVDYEMEESAEALVDSSGLRMLRDDEITDIAVHGGKVVGVLFSAVHGNEMNTSIAVDPNYRGSKIATTLFDSMYIDEHIDTHVAELVPPYTMEKFLISRGYAFTNSEGGFRVYKKDMV